MAAEKDIIVALELATTSIRAIAGQRLSDGTMQVLAFAEENSSHCVRKGIIDNIDKTTQAITRVLGQIGLLLGKDISRVYVGLGGQSLHSKHNHIQRTFTEKIQISASLIDQLMDTNRGMVYTDSEILEVVPQEYHVGNRAISDIVGMQAEQLDANFLNIIARSSLSENIEKCIHGASLEIAELLISPLSLGDSILSASEKRSGCALVDIGADTTTVNIYTNNILRKLIVLPIGSNNITMDIAKCFNTEPEEAENLKLKYGKAYYDDYDSTQGKNIKISHGREISHDKLCEIIEARYEEILRNVWAQIEDEADNLTSGIIFTGGGAQVSDITEAFHYIMKSDRQIRVVKGLPTDITVRNGVYIKDNGRINTILSLLLHGEQNCMCCTSPEPEEEAPVIENNSNTADTALHTEEPEPTDEEQETPKKKEKVSRINRIFKFLRDAVTEDED